MNVEYGLNLVEINSETNTAIFENVKTKERQTRPYSNLYSLLPCEVDQTLVKAGLATKESNFLLDVELIIRKSSLKKG